ncbi:hypothetical protein ACFSKY_07790 [Azotobacter chroococcum]|uniref:Uncharacterized protein n=1 Tax=Azotobacter chroococcum TaxID=353 RepID=A0A4R1PI31_9GAMM|nr:hypothetical protein [Azotobacter chroococcum]TBV97743.1 hypothetical protein E0E53_08240 [Azotobacter chroococcum]TCL28167.1 hypothetical protein EV691_12251 [Azotobacter chroococcum]
MFTGFEHIPLDKIAREWDDGHPPINPYLLASEMAALLRTLAPADYPIEKTHVSAILSNSAHGREGITYGELATYFDSASQDKAAATITTSSGAIPAASVLISRQWVNALANEATKRATQVAGLAFPANDSFNVAMVANASPIASYAEQLPILSGSEPGYLNMREAHLRRKGESSAAEQLDAERTARQRAERSEADKEAIIVALKAQLQRVHWECEGLRQEFNKSERERVKLAEQLCEHAGIIEFMNPDNPLSPVEGRRGVSAWCELTENGTFDPVAENGVGMGELARRWWKDRFGEPAGAVVRHLRWALTWPARKKGGMVAKRQREKG